ncbi:DinB family protein [Aquirufa ecclesiirivi]|uniref:DinB family protein n=1 Tax=Aquirufa ecclesiirivi TaxID=2715124 RepID=UPI0022A8805D|nr:DinB family protein [Aquirufa ecclesiirivi]MCZ2473271.1 DinB family protein [Aquirufa ecclesiirivi]MDF0692545.1 DinB family protein [Aquirufa ecclesiirivi]
MHSKTELLLELWVESRTRFTKLLDGITEADLGKKLGDSPNSAGFLIRHIGDVELLFAKNVFGDPSVKVVAKTVIDQRDTGEWTNLEELNGYVQDSFKKLYSIVSQQTDEDWEQIISTKEFGTKTKSEAFGRIVSHTAYHAGQLAIVLKYGHK